MTPRVARREAKESMSNKSYCLIIVMALLVGLAPSAGCVGKTSVGASRPQPSSSQAATATPGASAPVTATSGVAPNPAVDRPMTFAVIGGYGTNNRHERAVANLVATRRPDFVITTGDNYYTEAGGSQTGRYDNSAGQYYGMWMKDISTTGSRYPVGAAAINGFFPTLGNHDYSDSSHGVGNYLTYFNLPGAGFTNSSANERYYDFVQGPVHFFVLNSNTEEPDGVDPAGRQARWLRRQLAASTSTWNVVYFHHSPYTSGSLHPSVAYMRWPFAAWGADAVMSGHSHTYERIMRDGIVYFVNGLGGAERHNFGAPVEGTAARYNSHWGAQIVRVTDTGMAFEFYNTSGRLIDSYQLPAAP